ncbi:hypothetical protein Pint_14482 [Pistacia integerrima]|uniref:Uncharacterized protein n=1 Tax=Pistacia integerrima TaxID=434235 RepID=A0ACC0Y810_9ROSI|nr:hypothetical protein Pint_14482 [Pistacia integerrima]
MRSSLTFSPILLFLLRSFKYPRRLCSQPDDTSNYHQNPGAENRNSRDFQQIPNEVNVDGARRCREQYFSYSNEIHSRMVTSQVVKDFTEASQSIQNNGILEELDGFIKEGKVKEAVEVLGVLEKQCIAVDLPGLLNLMQACGEAKGLEEAKAVHEHIVRATNPLNVSTYNKILKTYSQCGSMDDAFNVFNNMEQRNLTSWDTMITGLAKNDLREDAVDCFSRFKRT